MDPIWPLPGNSPPPAAGAARGTGTGTGRGRDGAGGRAEVSPFSPSRLLPQEGSGAGGEGLGEAPGVPAPPLEGGERGLSAAGVGGGSTAGGLGVSTWH